MNWLLWSEAIATIVSAAIAKGLIDEPGDMWRWIDAASRNFDEASLDMSAIRKRLSEAEQPK